MPIIEINNGTFDYDPDADTIRKNFDDTKENFTFLDTTKANVEDVIAAANGALPFETFSLLQQETGDPTLIYIVTNDTFELSGYYTYDGSNFIKYSGLEGDLVEELDTRLTSEINDLDNSLGTQITGVDTKLTAFIDDVDLQTVPLNKNKANADALSPTLFWNSSLEELSAATSLYKAMIVPILPGNTYVFSGFNTNQGFGQGGYLDKDGNPLSNITVTISGSGRRFSVPSDDEIVFAAINVVPSDFPEVQLELGGAPSAYVAYEGKGVFDKKTSDPYLKLVNQENTVKYPNIWEKFPNFTEKYHNRDQDVVVAVWGTSLLARETNTTMRPDAPYRPPLAGANNVFSGIVDKLMWEGQQYRKYDAPGVFTETGSFAVAESGLWDDQGDREGKTKFSSTQNASVIYKIPEGAYQHNFIYRTDTSAATVVTVDVNEGNGLVEVFDGTNWVEANGFVFSQRESPATDTKGNTTYQKRLKMRCRSANIDSLAEQKTIKISKGDNTDRFMYLGVEWSPRQYMITFINAARGGHSFTVPGSSLIDYQDNDLYGFNPDLIIIETPIINEGASAFVDPRPARDLYLGRVEYWIYNDQEPDSVISRTNNFTDSEIIVMGDTVSILSGAIDPVTKEWNYADEQGTLDKISIMDGYRVTARGMMVKDNAYVNIFEEINRESILIYGNYYDAFTGSGLDGETFSNDGTHWNDLGSLAVLKYMLPLFDFN